MKSKPWCGPKQQGSQKYRTSSSCYALEWVRIYCRTASKLLGLTILAIAGYKPLKTALKALQDRLEYSVAIKGPQKQIPCVGGKKRKYITNKWTWDTKRKENLGQKEWGARILCESNGIENEELLLLSCRGRAAVFLQQHIPVSASTHLLISLISLLWGGERQQPWNSLLHLLLLLLPPSSMCLFHWVPLPLLSSPPLCSSVIGLSSLLFKTL